MTNEKSALQQMYDQILQEREEVQKNLDYNLAQIKEIEEYLVDIVEGEDTGFKVFSPRNAETVYREEIENSNTKKRQLEIENQIYYKKLNQLDFYLEGLSPYVKTAIKKNVQLDSFDLNVIPLILPFIRQSFAMARSLLPRRISIIKSMTLHALIRPS